jgi:hypothetical protein
MQLNHTRPYSHAFGNSPSRTGAELANTGIQQMLEKSVADGLRGAVKRIIDTNKFDRQAEHTVAAFSGLLEQLNQTHNLNELNSIIQDGLSGFDLQDLQKNFPKLVDDYYRHIDHLKQYNIPGYHTKLALLPKNPAKPDEHLMEVSATPKGLGGQLRHAIRQLVAKLTRDLDQQEVLRAYMPTKEDYTHIPYTSDGFSDYLRFGDKLLEGTSISQSSFGAAELVLRWVKDGPRSMRRYIKDHVLPNDVEPKQ